MNSGLYSAYSGLRANADLLEVLSNNLANLNTTGYKSDSSFFRVYNHALSESEIEPLDRAINDSTVVQGTMTDFRSGPLTATGRDLDVALEGPGFLVVETPAGERYTRNGHLSVSQDGTLVNSEGYAVLSSRGAIKLPPGKVSISQEGVIQVNGSRVDTLKVVDFGRAGRLEKMGNSLFAKVDPATAEQTPANTLIRQGSLEQSNVNPIQQMLLMISMMRQFEGLQKSIQMMMNTVNERSINQVGRVG
ncbi:MAG: flagellar basal-body rod protein FlgF [Acidobacteriota bacterium]